MYGIKISFSTIQPEYIGWIDPDRFLYKQLNFITGELRSWIYSLVYTIQNLLLSDFFLFSTTTDISPILWISLTDNPSEKKTGWSFFQDSCTKQPVRGDQQLINCLCSDQTLQQRFLDFDYRCFWTNTIKRYLAQIIFFRKKLAILIYLYGDQPVRTPEFLSVQYRNTANTHRNIFIENRQIVFAIRYHKNFYINNNPKIIYRYLLRTIGILFIYYLWLVLFLVERFDTLISSTDNRSTTVYTALLWRPDFLSQQFWISDCLRKIIQQEFYLGFYRQIINIVLQRYIAIVFSRRFFCTSSIFFQNINNNGETDKTVDPEIYSEKNFLDLQTGHSSYIAGIAYIRQLYNTPDTIVFRCTIFRNISQNWYHFLGFPCTDISIVPEYLKKKQKYTLWKNKQQKNQLTRRYKFANCNLETVLQYFLDNSAVQFKKKQFEILQTIQYRFSSIVTVISTGGKKSFLFQFSVQIFKDLTVIVVSLIVLYKKLQKQYTNLGISCTEQKNHYPPDEVSIVLVTPESALTGIFCIFLNRQIILYRLDRIVIDKYYTVLNCSNIFRPEFVQIGCLQQISIQTVFFTTILSPSLYDIFWRCLHSSHNNIFLYYSCTIRSNIVYRFFRPAINRNYQNFEQWIQNPQISRFIQSRRCYTVSGRILVYISLVQYIILLISFLDCKIFYSKIVIDTAGESQQQIDQKKILICFRRTDYTILVTTSTLDIEIDIPDICTVIYSG